MRINPDQIESARCFLDKRDGKIDCFDVPMSSPCVYRRRHIRIIDERT
jgi:hypothetical protein